MTEKYNIEKFNEFMVTNPTDDDVFQWFVRMNKAYKKEKKEGRINDDVMMELVTFWHDLAEGFGEDIFFLLEDKWEEPPVMVQDFLDFAPRFHEIKCEKVMEKLDPNEREETESLFKAIWDKNMRIEGSVSYYDWDEDEVKDLGLSVPRKDRDNYKFDLKKTCANVIYNRGNMFLKFFSRRGGFEVACVHVGDGRGTWECLSKGEIQSMYTDDAGNPMYFEPNEKVIFLDRPEHRDSGKVLYLH